MFHRGFLILFLCFSFYAQAHVEIPTNLDREDRIQVLDMLGFGTNSKILTDPYPLGGYAGFEAGVQVEAIPVSDLADLGDTAKRQDYYYYPIISIGKGVYNNFDIFVHFIPFSQGTGISEYGGIIRWGFFQMAYLPISFSVQINADSANINNQLFTRNYGFDLTTGLTAQNFYFYFGGGETYTSGTFVGGITNTGGTESEKDHKLHIFFGLGFHIMDSVFISAQMDHFTQPNYALKLGFRY